MSDVEKFFYATQEKLGGNLQWTDLNPQTQHMYIQAINLIKNVGEARK